MQRNTIMEGEQCKPCSRPRDRGDGLCSGSSTVLAARGRSGSWMVDFLELVLLGLFSRAVRCPTSPLGCHFVSLAPMQRPLAVSCLQPMRTTKLKLQIHGSRASSLKILQLRVVLEEKDASEKLEPLPICTGFIFWRVLDFRCLNVMHLEARKISAQISAGKQAGSSLLLPGLWQSQVRAALVSVYVQCRFQLVLL